MLAEFFSHPFRVDKVHMDKRRPRKNKDGNPHMDKQLVVVTVNALKLMKRLFGKKKSVMMVKPIHERDGQNNPRPLYFILHRKPSTPFQHEMTPDGKRILETRFQTLPA
jgi:hypothetical protein